MRMSDIMSHAGLAWYAEVALVLFFGVFVGVVVWTFLPSRRRTLDAQARLPLEPDEPPAEEPDHE